ncbi:endonuclease/exonuclease/phosphatase family protein [Candidatus Peregrinibacteria bacterium]|nr:endonuclease/exonuclease/phosphatase family protein [Candidatus Peregrinibacteria bacterium]
MKILIYNIAYSTGLKGTLAGYLTNFWRYLFWAPRKNFRNLSEFLKQQNADVVCLIEADTGSFRNRFKSQVGSIAKTLSFPYCWSASKYGPQSPSRLLPTLRKQHDAVLSRIEGSMNTHYLKQGAKKLVQEFIAQDISIFVVHLALRASVRQKQLKELTAMLHECPRPHLVCGDFNIFKGLHEVRDFMDNNHLSLVQGDPTFPSFHPTSTIDLILRSDKIRVKNSGVPQVLFSDHLPVWVEIE